MTAVCKHDPLTDSLDQTTSDDDAAASVGDEKAVGEKSPGAFRTIGEAAGELGLKPHVLRFWETKFEALSPMKRDDGRRYYRPEDMELLLKLKTLLHVQGMTIRGAIRVLEGGEATEAEANEPPVAAGPGVRDLQGAVLEAVERGDFHSDLAAPDSAARSRLERVLEDLCDLKARIDAARAAA